VGLALNGRQPKHRPVDGAISSHHLAAPYRMARFVGKDREPSHGAPAMRQYVSVAGDSARGAVAPAGSGEAVARGYSRQL
jgi:hypothetical protein